MAKNKLLLTFKYYDYAVFYFAFIGAKKLKYNITKAELKNYIIMSSYKGSKVCIYDKDYIGYSLKELCDLGIAEIDNLLNKLLNLRPIRFIKEFEKLELKHSEYVNLYGFDAEKYRMFAIALIEKEISGPIAALKKADKDNIVRIMLPSNEDFKDCYDREIGDEGDEEDNKDTHTSYYYTLADAPFSKYYQIEKVVKKYSELVNLRAYYNIIIQEISKFENDALEKYGYKKEYECKYQENIEDTIEFVLKFNEFIDGKDVFEYIDDYTKEQIRNYSVGTSASVVDRYELRRTSCTKGCSLCIFTLKKCIGQWVKEDMKKIIKVIVEKPILQESTLHKQPENEFLVCVYDEINKTDGKPLRFKKI
ncbi:hypothetical protein G9F71_016400 [Clostridium sp. FP2]|uniref:hypothetical protein n=1 Tax=Clostridium sp. FP2 TaxID=2724481 RepID=UPI0013E96233|nr:hypothetical protein [Clostridium sp. FP2]MBZ9624433.1 hypothetical protein [Clostridium sp. FP2]